jgi:ATP-binding cassette subfamily B protein
MEVMAGRATIGNLAEFVVYVNMLTWPVASLGWVVTLIQRAAASQKRINEFLHFDPDIVSGNVTVEPFEGHIQFHQVSYQYPGTEVPALKEITFELPPGKTLGITGRTGSGKSTLAMLLLRQDDIQQGTIRLDGKDIKSIHLPSYRRLTGYVPQDAFLFSDTIMANITFGKAGARTEEVMEAARLAEVHQDIEQFSHGYETVIGERGITLSGGQKQRIAMARAFLRKPRLLVLDDCLNAVDTQTEKAILSNIKKISSGITTVLISHKLSVIRHADEILVLDHGSIAEKGKHEELIHAGGIYAGIHQLQQMEIMA